jgi:neutral trehalase
MFKYRPHSQMPRAESYCADVKTASKTRFPTEILLLWNDLASIAESGWDFSCMYYGIYMHVFSINYLKSFNFIKIA